MYKIIIKLLFMKYKDKTIRELDVLSNRLSGLRNALDNNKTITKEELLRQLDISIKSTETISEQISLEDNDFARPRV